MKKHLMDYLKNLSSLDEIFAFIHRNNIEFSDRDINELQDYVIKQDQRGKWCILLAEKFNGKVDISKIEDAVIKKDRTGQFCYILAKNVPNVDIEKLRKAVYEKDHSGVWKMKFDENIGKK
ncbi:MAG: hypothetical protein N2712_00540 [Brevinematales bacterium]|nr:hypothetical protein [Brevinematales bacterium]